MEVFMREKSLVSLFIIALLLAACATPTSVPTAVVTENPIGPTASPIMPTPYPEPFIEMPSPYPAYPEPSTPAIPPSGYDPQPGDAKLQRDKVLMDLENSTIFINADNPTEVEVMLNGILSDPCHELRVVVRPPDATNTINVEVYTVFDKSIACIMVIKTFNATIPLGNYSSGEYTVMVNGKELGTFTGGYEPQPGDARLSRGEATVDVENSQVLVMESYPIQVSVILKGNLPDPCHKLRVLVTPANTQNEINLDVYSVVDSSKACITELQPFEVTIPLGSVTSGHYTVYVNGQLLGEFDG
jgi:hypothetical protein